MAGDTSADPLIIRELRFLGGMATAGGWRPAPELPEVAFAGRSNVGKSSLLNTLVRRKAFARVSRTPGRTREINFFQVNEQLVLVDLPGYGYARLSRDRRAEWVPLIESYLRTSGRLRGVVLLLDVRRDPSAEDRRMVETLAELGLPTIVAVTKTDKLSATRAAGRVRELAAEIGIPEDQVIAFSGVTGAGRRELAEAIVSLIEDPSWRAA
jgi:GTP-binding protein